MNVTIFGSGYVGLVTGACLADAGNHVICVDVDAGKVARLNAGEVPIHEPGLDGVIARNMKRKRISFTTDAAAAVAHGEIQFIAVGTPPGEDGSADLRYVLKVAETIGQYLRRYAVVVTKSTVPVGTVDRVNATVAEALAQRGAKLKFDAVSNPEFLKEGAAIRDFNQPDRVVVGCSGKRAEALMRKLYAPFTAKRGRNGPERMLVMDVRSAELTKYAANAMLATRISFMNELAQIAERVGADIDNVRRGIGSDTRIGNSFINPGTGYGGSCFPKDVKALVRAAHTVGYEPAILNSVEAVNDRQKHVLVGKLRRIYGDNLAGRCFAVWGLAFKPDTDDMREAPSVVIIHELLAAGATVRVHDPVAMTEARRELGALAGITWCTDHFEAATGADALLIVTEWQQYRNASLTRLRSVLKAPRIFDGRNLHDPARMARLKFEYYAIGRGLQAVV